MYELLLSLYRVFNLNRNPDYDSICKLWWLQRKKTKYIFCFYLFGRTYRTALQQTFPGANTSCVPKFCYLSVYNCLIRHFLIRICIAKASIHLHYLLVNTVSRPDIPLISQLKASCHVAVICAGFIFLFNERWRRRNRRHWWTGHLLKEWTWYGDNFLADFKVEDRIGFTNFVGMTDCGVLL
jgi:hypothetical protein